MVESVPLTGRDGSEGLESAGAGPVDREDVSVVVFGWRPPW